MKIVSVQPKWIFSFRPKPKFTETAIFLLGRNRKETENIIFISAETDTETETMPLIEIQKSKCI